MIKRFLNTTFGIRDGELRISFLMQFYVFLIITVLLIIKPIVNALFLSELGSEQLPYGYILVAIIAVAVTYFYNRWVKSFSFRRVTTLTYIFFGLSFVLLGISIKVNFIRDWFLYTFYIGVSIFAVVTTSQFWILANLVFNSREAKRLFGFIGAGAIAGGVFGGYLTSILASGFGNEIAVFVAAGLLLVCIPILHRIWNLKIKKLSIHVRAQRKNYDVKSYEPAYKIVSKSKHLTYLALITGIGVIVAKLVDFQFSDFANAAISDPDELASFFGFWFSSFNVIALCLQLFLTNKVLSKLGVSTSLLVLPLGIAIGSLLFLTFPELLVLIIIKGIDGSFKQSLNKAAVELSIMPIPFNIKNQAKSFIDVAVDSIATGIAGLMLIFFIKRFNLPTSYITIIVLFLSLIWILLIYKLRETYFNSFRLNIQRNLAISKVNNRLTDRETTLGIKRKALKSQDEKQILNVLKGLSTYKIKALHNEIVKLLDFPSNKVKVEVIKQLYNYDKGAALENIKPLIHTHDDELVHTALSYVLEYSNISHTSFYYDYLDHKDDNIASSALLCLSEDIAENERLEKQFNLKKRIEDRLNILEKADDNLHQGSIAKLMLTIAHAGYSKYYSYINLNLKSTNPYILKHAIKAAGLTVDVQYVPLLLEYLGDKRLRKPALKALRKYSSKITNTILKMSINDELSQTSKRYVPMLVGVFNNQNSVKVLIRFLKNKDVVTRFESSKALIKLKSKNESLYFNKRRLKKEIIRECTYSKNTLDALASMRNIIQLHHEASDIKTDDEHELLIARQSVIDVLDEQLHMSLKTIFKILGLLYDQADIAVSYSGLNSDVKEAQINALEFLDNLLQSQIKLQIIPLVEYYNVNNETQDNNTSLHMEIKDEKTIIESLLQKRGKRMKLELLYLIRVLNDKTYLPIVYQQTAKTSKHVSAFAVDTITLLNKKQLVIS